NTCATHPLASCTLHAHPPITKQDLLKPTDRGGALDLSASDGSRDIELLRWRRLPPLRPLSFRLQRVASRPGPLLVPTSGSTPVRRGGSLASRPTRTAPRPSSTRRFATPHPIPQR